LDKRNRVNGYPLQLQAYSLWSKNFQKRVGKIKNNENKTLLFDIFKKQAAIFTFGLVEPINT
jgi:hypothetical protein